MYNNLYLNIMNQKRLKIVAISVAIFIVGLFAYAQFNNMNNFFDPNPPKDNYSKMWEKVDSLESQGLTESAKMEVEKIKFKAKVEKNREQQIKTFLYLSKYKQSLEEDEILSTLKEINDYIAEFESPYKEILYSIKADIIWQYYNSIQYQVNQRTTIENNTLEESEIDKWDTHKFIKEGIKNYKLSLQNKQISGKTKVEEINELLVNSNENNKLRPTIYDLLAYRALSFYNDSRIDAILPIDRFVINETNYFENGNVFKSIKISDEDSLSRLALAVKVYQSLYELHNDDALLILLDLHRMNFVYSNIVIGNKEETYINALKSMIVGVSEKPEKADVYYELAKVYSENASLYDAANETTLKYKNYYNEAISYCDKAIAEFETSIGANNCKILKRDILRKEFSCQVENAQLKNKPILVHADYRNVEKINFQVFKFKYEDFKTKIVNRDYEIETYKNIIKNKSIKDYQFLLKGSQDRQSHSTEVPLDGLDYGFYVIAFKTEDGDNDLKGYTTFWSTEIGVSFLNNIYSTNQEIDITNRNDGSPIKNAKVDFYNLRYDYGSRQYETVKIFTSKTNKNGKAKYVVNPSNYYNLSMDVKSGNDRYYVDNVYIYNSNLPNSNYESARVFLDRSIYRPGQTVYFKVLATKNSNRKEGILAGRKIQLVVRDINYKEITSISITTNDFGTANGSFTIPMSCANGSWQITSGGSNPISIYQNFSVEEYKRPKFEVNIDTVKGEYALNDMVKVKGSAMALAGYGISDAKVTYKVEYTPYYRRCWWDWWTPYGNTETVHIGETKTNEKGEFEIDFKAIANANLDEKYDPYYYFAVTADVTDLSGETRSNTYSIIVSNKMFQLSTTLPRELNISKDTLTYKFLAQNYNGFDITVDGTYELKELKTPSNFYRTRPFEIPDEKLLTKDQFKALFPTIPYENENQMAYYEKGNLLKSGNFNSSNNNKINKDDYKNLKSGHYELTIKAKDSKGNLIQTVHYFNVYNDNAGAYPLNDFLSVNNITPYVKSGDKLIASIGTVVSNAKVNIKLEYNGEVKLDQVWKMNKEQKKLEFQTTKGNFGNYTLHVYLMNGNHVEHKSLHWFIGDDTKNLKLELVTFRNKVIPGSKEEWKLKVTGNQNEKVMAEILASMYDASLDQITEPSYWNYGIYDYYLPAFYNFSSYMNQNHYASNLVAYDYDDLEYKNREFYYLNFFGLAYYYGYNWGLSGGNYRDYGNLKAPMATEGAIMDEAEEKVISQKTDRKESINKDSRTKNTEGYDGLTSGGEKPNNQGTPDKIRSNFNETAFFYPNLVTDENGEIFLKFTMPESLTKWRFRAMASTKDARTSYTEKYIEAQKDLMITSFAPRFLREGDVLYFSAKVTNLTDKTVTANCKLDLEDAITIKSANQLITGSNSKAIELGPKESKKVEWTITIPQGINALTTRIYASTETHKDGEEITIPILPNRILVTEAVPFSIRANSTKDYKFTNLLKSSKSTTLKHERLTLEITSNPAWYAIQALPYMMEYPYECAEQTFNRYYANAIGAHIANSDERIAKVFTIWKNYQPDALLSNLEKNQELKQILIEETPWLRDAKDETTRKHRLGILLDLNRMNTEADVAVNKLRKMQSPNGGFPWFEGGPDSRYITQYIVCGIGHLRKMGIKDFEKKDLDMLTRAVQYLDEENDRDYQYLIRYKVDLSKNNIGHSHIQYLYTRSFFPEISMNEKYQKAYDYVVKQTEKYWLEQNNYSKGMIALAHFRKGNKIFSEKVILSLKQNAIKSEELGMYWKNNSSWYWYDAPIETQALLIEAFNEVTKDVQSVDEMRIWLLKNKQTNDWKTTKATADACYALLLNGTQMLADDPEIIVNIGDRTINTLTETTKEAGTGYLKKTFESNTISDKDGNIKVTKKGNNISWGAVYWQYFEQLDKIPSSLNTLQVVKKIYRQNYTNTGNVLQEITSSSPLKIGDRLVVRLELKVDRAMEYVHIKDLRASTLEPENTTSGYRYQEGLYYYENTRDAATNFFVEFMPKGSYVFEYNLRVTHAGNFSNGLTTIQCMYAPEFTSHTAGIRLEVKE